ncbi:hypothetical protein FOIG_00669 [Fusarium odoratissimum NRRL 54006]|uniref:Uncharacterized protein n=1 Tax=Fusarium odoratissimum (strain NRRL 54006) TaxID=1089451 RepID=X0KPH7_FUSO5|nr:uncharacterized protein FOIG_00669 [Fusarium odoratissimum NRRL 54006]EXM10662.1 hypothetical protein FOIG_00669 [Fusarium odoratissimum NRRL 54006]
MGKWVDGDGWALTPRFLVPAPPSKPKPASPRQCTSRPTHGAQVTAEGVEQQSKQRVALSLTSEHLSRRIESWWKTVDPSKGGVRFKVDHVSDFQRIHIALANDGWNSKGPSQKGQKVAPCLGWLGGRDKDKDGMREKPSRTMSGNFIQQTDQAERLLLCSQRSSPPHSPRSWVNLLYLEYCTVLGMNPCDTFNISHPEIVNKI